MTLTGLDHEQDNARFNSLTDFVADECGRRLKAYTAQPRDAREHYETEIEVLSGGYAYRQLFELVQNAADAIGEGGQGHGRIHIKLDRQRLIAANTGAPLDRDGIVALLNARSSSKRAGQIGRFGIGFKSLLKLGGTVDLVSRSIGLRFDPEWCREQIRSHLGLSATERAPSMRLARVIDPRSPDGPLSSFGHFHWATTFVCAEIADSNAYERLAHEMHAFPAEFVLFLENNIELTLEVAGGSIRTIRKQRDGHDFVITDCSNEARWRLFETRVRINDPAARSDALELQARDEVPLAWAIPLGGREQAGNFWAFFPTQSATYLPGILNAPWKLNSDRTSVIPGPWNNALMREAAALVARHIRELATREDPGSPIAALPRRLDRQDDLATSLVKPLWDMLVDGAFVADGHGVLSTAANLARHPIDDAEALRSWSGFAGDAARGATVHATCQSSRLRSARLEALSREAGARLLAGQQVPLRTLSEVEWLEAAARCDPASAVAFLHFVDELVTAKRVLQPYGIRQAKIVLTQSGTLVSPDQAIFAPASRAPAGLFSVASAVAEDERARQFLIDVLDVREMSDEVWNDVLDDALQNASYSNNCDAWSIFWNNISEAPAASASVLLGKTSQSQLHFKNMVGRFAPRSELLVLDASGRTELAPDLILDHNYHAPHWERLPADLKSEYPASTCDAVGSWEGLNGEKIVPYFARVKQLGWPQITGNPRQEKLDIIGKHSILMPASWRLLPSLPPHFAAILTIRLIGSLHRAHQWNLRLRATDQEGPFPVILYGHTTRRESYKILSAPHPLLFWIMQYGWIWVGACLLPAKCLTPDLIDVVGKIGALGGSKLQNLANGLNVSTEIRMDWPKAVLDESSRQRFWTAVFKKAEEFSGDFRELRSLWEYGAKDGHAPTFVPTTSGALSIDQIFVTCVEASSPDASEDGRIVLLSRSAAEIWRAAGARDLCEYCVVEYAEQLSAPIPVGDMFPELADFFVNHLSQPTDAAWVRGLIERSGHRNLEPVVAQDSTGLLVVDHERATSLARDDRARHLLQTMHELGLVTASPDKALEQIDGARIADLRTAVRSACTLPERLLRAVGGSTAPLIAILPQATLGAVTGVIADEQLAELALAVHGPTVLAKLVGALREAGLNPPSRWGNEAARAFVTELGFPIEFATSTNIKRDPELLISGPSELPPLHDYQVEILDAVEKLFTAGKGRRRAVISLPTGGGKTRVAAEAIVKIILSRKGARSALWIAQTDELCEQAVQCFRQLWTNVGSPGEDLRVIRLWGGQADPVPPEFGEIVVVVASIQTLNARLNSKKLAWLSRPGAVVIDECHHAIAPSYSSILRWLDVQTGSGADRAVEPPLLGLSATPWRGRDDDESARLAARFDRRWLPADQDRLHSELRKRRVLADLRYSPIHYEKPVMLSDADIRHFEQYGELPDAVVENIGRDPDRNDRIVESILSTDAASILLFANSVAHAQYLAARLHLSGCSAAAVSGDTDRLARNHFVRRFRSGELRVMCNHSVLTTGFDAPKADMILISRPVFSPVRYMQMVGRGLRGPANGGTESCQIITIEDNILNYRDKLAYHFCRRFFVPES